MWKADFQKKIGYKFKNEGLLETALTHSSYANENKLSYNNERLEFLGDSVLGFITADYLYNSFGKVREGELTKIKAFLVCESSLFGFAKEIGLGEYILLGRGEEQTGGSERPSVVSDAFEAVIAAVFLDGGIKVARSFVLGFIVPAIEKRDIDEDYKTMLQELIQKERGNSVRYELIAETGPDHDKVFTAAVILNGKVVGEGSGKSKKEAQQSAAKAALELL
ncbi:MAG: Ribonuclease 3 [Firmicutes bacterium ADurb.Bin300]|nr:MAG: Ribonuclease 3 [Firmicutes bacterium ADurb.Bin300]HOD01745.1 ribonuclease III [Clostridiales bacterium]